MDFGEIKFAVISSRYYMQYDYKFLSKCSLHEM